MAFHSIKYTIKDEGVNVLLGCAARQAIEEQGKAIANAFSEIDVIIDVDDDWGICKIIAVNGMLVEG